MRPAELALALLEAPDVDAVLADGRVDVPAFRERAEAAATQPPPKPLGESLLAAILARGGRVAGLLRERGIDEDLLDELSR